MSCQSPRLLLLFESSSYVTSCARIFRICELLITHKDVFKKHTVGLIMRFIQSLNSGISTSVKSKIMPSIHGLLEMCSDYEMRQINAMIDAPSKALFSPIFQSYQKYYQYHGA